MISKARQEKAIGEGLALGFISLGIPSISSSSQTIDHGFAHAWRNWSQAGKFPQIRGTIPTVLIYPILRMSERRHSIAAWDVSGRRYFPYLRFDHWTVEMVAEGLLSEVGVPLSDWQSLARDFTKYDEPQPVEPA
jgi:hypothetical protein